MSRGAEEIDERKEDIKTPYAGEKGEVLLLKLEVGAEKKTNLLLAALVVLDKLLREHRHGCRHLLRRRRRVMRQLHVLLGRQMLALELGWKSLSVLLKRRRKKTSLTMVKMLAKYWLQVWQKRPVPLRSPTALGSVRFMRGTAGGDPAIGGKIKKSKTKNENKHG